MRRWGSPTSPGWPARPASPSWLKMPKLNIGIIGGGLITQVEHLPNLLALPDMFRVAGVVDPSASLRAYLAERWGVAAFETAEALLAMPLDGVVIATPDCYHADLAVLALQQ